MIFVSNFCNAKASYFIPALSLGKDLIVFALVLVGLIWHNVYDVLSSLSYTKVTVGDRVFICNLGYVTIRRWSWLTMRTQKQLGIQAETGVS